jgi:hypothetical protein
MIVLQNPTPAFGSDMNWSIARFAFSAAFLVTNVGLLGIAGSALSQDETASAGGPTRPPEALRAIHDQASQARERRDYATVDRLRRERIEALKFVKEASAWTGGIRAIEKAEKLLQSMRYREAAAVISEAWRPFLQSREASEPVFGDLAVKIFEIRQAALAVYPEQSPMFPALSNAEVKSAIDRAIKTDPCQVEAIAIDAFLTRPDPDESFQPAELQGSLRRRNARLLDITYVASETTPVQPWHAVAEFLKAKSSSFVLNDLSYIRDFLDPRTRLLGRDREGERFAVVLGGAMLVNDRDPDARVLKSRFFVDEFVPGSDGNTGRWVRMRPEFLAVAPRGGSEASGEMRLSKAKIIEQITNLENQLFPDLDSEFKERCTRLATRFGFPEADVIPAQVEAILNDRPPPGQRNLPQVEPATQQSMELKLERLGREFRQYAAALARRRKADAARDAVAVADTYDALLREYKVQKSTEENAESRGEWKKSLAIFQPSADATGSESWSSREWLESVRRFRDEITSLQRDLDRQAMGAAAVGAVVAEAGDPGEDPVARAKDRLAMCSELLGLLDKVVILEYCQRAVDKSAIEKIAEIAKPGDERATPATVPQQDGSMPGSTPAERRAAGLLKAASQRLRSAILAEPEDGSKMNDITASRVVVIRDQLDAIRSALRVLPQPAGTDSGLSPAEFFDGFTEDCQDFFDAMALELEFQQQRSQLAEVRSWTLERFEWRFSDFPAGMPVGLLANLIDGYPRVVVSAQDLESIDRAIAAGSVAGISKDAVPLRSACSSIGDNPLVLQTAAGPVLNIRSTGIDRPRWAIALVIHEADQVHAGPKCKVADDGEDYVIVEDRGMDRRALIRLGNGSGSVPQLVVEYPGVQGRLDLAARADPYPVDSSQWRYLEDRRGNRISITPIGSPRLLRIVAPNGQELIDRSVNYSTKDWMDLDRNIVNEFMPQSLTFGPSLPTWMAYRRELERPRPAVRSPLMWSVPRPLFRIAN